MTAEEDGRNEDDLDVFRPERPLPLSADLAQRLFEEAWPADPAPPYADPAADMDMDMDAGSTRVFTPTRPLGLLVGTAILAVCGLLVVVVIRESAPLGGDSAVTGASPAPGVSLPALPDGPAGTGSPSATPSAAHLEPGLETAASRIPATPAAHHSAAGSDQGQADTSAKPSATATAGSGHTSTSKPTPQVTRWSVRSVNYPDRYWSYRDGLGYLDPVSGSSSSRTRAGATFTVVAGLADASCYSFKVSGGRYLRHRDFRIRAEASDGSSLFRKDATFCAHWDSGSGTVSFTSFNYPNRYLRHRNFQLWIDPYQNSSLFRSDSTFRIASPWG
ncbi:AbfB domain-containing protein [Streptomyces sp. NBC_01537]|uniref:AbfB domain-containing protein n=1 Tax=Streptomyces sp. NBC_01537 TaxID=2903896 RepID=UPI00386977F4